MPQGHHRPRGLTHPSGQGRHAPAQPLGQPAEQSPHNPAPKGESQQGQHQNRPAQRSQQQGRHRGQNTHFSDHDRHHGQGKAHGHKAYGNTRQHLEKTNREKGRLPRTFLEKSVHLGHESDQTEDGEIGHPEARVGRGAGGHGEDQRPRKPQGREGIGLGRQEVGEVDEAQHDGGAGGRGREAQQDQVACCADRQNHRPSPLGEPKQPQKPRQKSEQKGHVQTADGQQMGHPRAGEITADRVRQGGLIPQKERGGQSLGIGGQGVQLYRQTAAQCSRLDGEAARTFGCDGDGLLGLRPKPRKIPVAHKGGGVVAVSRRL